MYVITGIGASLNFVNSDFGEFQSGNQAMGAILFFVFMWRFEW